MTSILAVSGSLRRGSSNTALLEAAARVSPSDINVLLYTELASIPAFDPDLEEAGVVPTAVLRWRAVVTSADAVLISSPEYAHGVPGALKNALDWLVGSAEFVGKRVGLLSASSASTFAHSQLVEILTVMSTAVVRDATVVIDIPRRGVTARSLAESGEVAERLRSVLRSLAGTSVG